MAMTTLVKNMTSDGTAVITYPMTYMVVDAPGKVSPAVQRDKALAYVNTARNALGLPVLEDLPKGHIGNGRNCVIARALPDMLGVGNQVVFTNEKTAKIVAETWGMEYHASIEFGCEARGWHVALPGALTGFISCFDYGLYPDLIADGSSEPL